MQAALATRPLKAPSERTDLTSLAKQRLEHHPHFRGRVAAVSFEQQGKTLYLLGRLPSFYLKQLVQETVRTIPGVQAICNEIDVVSPEGVSSVRHF